MSDWKEEAENQVKYCGYCHEPILLVDWLKIPRNKSTWYNWKTYARVCLGEKQVECTAKYNAMKNKAKKPFFDRATAVAKFRALREALGFEEADNESTFSPWDLVEVSMIKNMAGINRVVQTPEQQAYKDAMLYFWSVQEDYFKYENREKTKKVSRVKKNYGEVFHVDNKMQNFSSTNLWYLYAVFKTMFPNEWKDVPVWAISGKTRASLYQWQIIDEYLWKRDGRLNHTFLAGLFDKMIAEWYPDGITYQDYISLSELSTYQTRKQTDSPWFPANDLFNYKRGQMAEEPVFTKSVWTFVSMFQRHYSRKENGTFGKFMFNKMDFKVHSNVSHRQGYNADEITKADCYNWFWNYFVPYFGIEIEDKENFPYNTPVNELLQFVNIPVRDMSQVVGLYKFMGKLGQPRGVTPSPEKVIRLLYPDYKFDMVLWTTEATKAEKKMNQILLKVMTRAGFDWYFSNAEYIPTEDGDIAKYWDTQAPMKIDGISLLLKLIVEAQGAYHYLFDDEVVFLNDGINYSRKVPESYRGKDRTVLGYRQDRDRLCRKAIVRNGFTPVYVILFEGAYPVKGVHGDIPQWNGTYVTSERSRGRIGLAETFDMQGREDIGDMIRDYYYNVVLNEEE